MGIKNLTKIIKRVSPDSLRTGTLGDFVVRGDKVAIDVSIIMYKFLHNQDKFEDIHISGFIKLTMKYLSLGVTPVYVFEGKSPIEKEFVLQGRRETKVKKTEEVDNLTQIVSSLPQGEELTIAEEKLEKAKRSNIIVNSGHFKDIKDLLNILGVPVITPLVGEAEQVACVLQKRGLVQHVASDDMDCLPFGCTSLLRFSSKNEVECISLPKLLSDLDFKEDQFIDMCILCGSDYCPTIPRCGCITSLKAMTEYKSIELILEKLVFKSIENNFKDNFVNARDIFKDQMSDIVVCAGDLEITKSDTTIDLLEQYLSKRSWTEDQIKKITSQVKKNL